MREEKAYIRDIQIQEVEMQQEYEQDAQLALKKSQTENH